MKNWKPEVGEKCLFNTGRYSNSWVEVLPIGLTSQGTWAFEYVEDGCVGALSLELVNDQKDYFKPLPTEEDKLVDEMRDILYRDISKYGCSACGDAVDAKPDHKQTAKILIKAGYRKIEPFKYIVKRNPLDSASLIVGSDKIPMPSASMRDAMWKRLSV